MRAFFNVWLRENDKSSCDSIVRYRKWNIGDDLNIIVRCEHDGVMAGSNGETQFLNIKTLNEWDTKVSDKPFFGKRKQVTHHLNLSY